MFSSVGCDTGTMKIVEPSSIRPNYHKYLFLKNFSPLLSAWGLDDITHVLGCHNGDQAGLWALCAQAFNPGQFLIG